MTGFLAKPVSKQSLLAALLPAFGQAPGVAAIATKAAGADPTDEAVDWKGFAGLKEAIGEDGVARLVAMFEAETSARLIRIADRRLDRGTLTREVHSLKGAAGTACAVWLAGRAAGLEMRLKRGEEVEEVDVSALTEAFEAWRGEVQEAEAREAATV
jgi:HPt (histidine-containing phosphotransfer) domain-containing protein